MTPLDFRFLAVEKGDSVLLKGMGLALHVALSLQPCSPKPLLVLLQKVLSHLLKKEPADLPADCWGTSPQFRLPPRAQGLRPSDL